MHTKLGVSPPISSDVLISSKPLSDFVTFYVHEVGFILERKNNLVSIHRSLVISEVRYPVNKNHDYAVSN